MTPSEPPSSMRRVAPPPPVVKLKNAAINGIDGEQHSRVSSSKTTTSNISVRNANSSWLLRLFQSEFFDSRLALCYLFRYPESVGMHHYICDQLKNFDLREIEFLLPQLCHLLVTRHTRSVALESFIFEQCQTSPHFAIMTVWTLSAYIHDLNVKNSSARLKYVKRIYHKLHEIAKEDGETSILRKINSERARENAIPALVGMGAILGSVGVPVLMNYSKQMLLSEVRKVRSWTSAEDNGASSPDDDGSRYLNRPQDINRINGLSHGSTRTSFAVSSTGSISDAGTISPVKSSTPASPVAGGAMKDSLFFSAIVSSPSLEDLHRGQAFHRHRSPSPLTQLKKAATEFSFSSSNYFHDELQFVMALVDISERLALLPKEARQSTLIAELSLMNHNLPADVCVPLWCNASGKQHRHHHKVVRISPSDAVILNSADRVPYLIFVEVLEYSDEESLPPRSLTNGHNHESETESAPATPTTATTLSKFESRRESVISPPPVAAVRIRTASNRSSAEPSTNSPTTAGNSSLSSSPQSPSARSNNLSSYEYYRTVLNRRSIHALQYTGSSVRPPTAISIPSIDEIHAASTVSSPTAEEFQARMRTAAVMLAQLYRQQAEEGDLNAAISNGSTGSTSIDGDSTEVALANKRTSPRKQTKTAKLMFDDIRNRIIKEMMLLESKRRGALELKRKLGLLGDGKERVSLGDGADEVLQESEEQSLREVCAKKSKDDPSAAVFREPWEGKRDRIRTSSPFGKHPQWRLLSVIVKTGADLRQEQLAVQLIREIQRVWQDASVPTWVYYFRVLVASSTSGLIETIRDAISIHSIKKDAYARSLNQHGLVYTLYDYFVKEFGQPGCDNFQKAQDNFMKSLAAYSIIAYVLQVKDRHNGNILLDNEGHIIHIDFGFMLCNSPGSVGFELAPFKMPQEYVDILGGIGSAKFEEFRGLMKEGFLALRKKCDQLVSLVEMMEKDSLLPCFTGYNTKPQGKAPSFAASLYSYLPMGAGGSKPPQSLKSSTGSSLNGPSATPSSATSPFSPPLTLTTTSIPTSQILTTSSSGTAPTGPSSTAASALRDRFQLQLTESQVCEFVDKMIDSSCGNVFTRLYDSFQYYSNGIL